jgi:DNA helicase-2/ATP-dependent DNA helicase PcrA
VRQVKDEENGARGRGSDGLMHEPIQISAGDTVFHDRWGEGVVLSVSGAGHKAEATITFEEVGQKRLMLAYAPLAKR